MYIEEIELNIYIIWIFYIFFNFGSVPKYLISLEQRFQASFQDINLEYERRIDIENVSLNHIIRIDFIRFTRLDMKYESYCKSARLKNSMRN